jgi:hypothetical protein
LSVQSGGVCSCPARVVQRVKQSASSTERWSGLFDRVRLGDIAVP